MESLTPHHLFKTKLRDRTLWFDGDSSFNPDTLLTAYQKYDNIKYVDWVNDLVREYNKHCSKEQELRVKEQSRPLSFDWTIPDEYKNLDVRSYVERKLSSHLGQCSTEEHHDRAHRCFDELDLYEKKGHFDVLRAIIYVINTLSTHNVVWGIGRGSSVSSYVLYLIGVHDVDSFAYGLDVADFLHD